MKYNVNIHGLVNGQKVTLQTMEEVKEIMNAKLPIRTKMDRVEKIISEDPIVKEQMARNRLHAGELQRYIEYHSIAQIRSTLYSVPMYYSKGSAPNVADHVTGYAFTMDDCTKLYIPFDTKANTYFGSIEVRTNPCDVVKVPLTTETRSKLLLALNELEQTRMNRDVENDLEQEQELEY